MIKGWKKLTKDERNHVHFDAGCRSTASFQRNIDLLAKHDRENDTFACLDCRLIARKVGMKPNGGWSNKCEHCGVFFDKTDGCCARCEKQFLDGVLGEK